MAHMHANLSQFGCRFILRDSVVQTTDWSYALCGRKGVPRLVSDDECARCPSWQPAPDRPPGREPNGTQ